MPWSLLPVYISYPAVFLLGTTVGSFLNVCIYRLPWDRSIVSPPSHCYSCGARLRAYDLVPLFSFLFLGGKCRACGAPISWRYFAIEALTGLAFLAIWAAALATPKGPGPELLAQWAFAGVLIAVFFTDLDHMIIPDRLVIAGLVIAVLREAYLIGSGQLAWLSQTIPGTQVAVPRLIAGAVLGAVFFAAIEVFSQLVFHREGMGRGDLKLGAAIGAFLGPQLALLSFGLAIVAGAVWGIMLIILRLRRRMEYIPFGPFLAVSAFALLAAQRQVVEVSRGFYRWWLSLYGIHA